MEKSYGLEATLLLGSGGFLGTALSKVFFRNGFLYRSIRDKSGAIQDSLGQEVSIEVLGKYGSLQVINCSSGRFQSFDDALASNYTFPLEILKSTTEVFESIKWVQFDSYTQYSKGEVHDVNYVNTKNKFNEDLDLAYGQRVLSCLVRVSLPHLYGAGDNPMRFLPRSFRKILRGDELVVPSPGELLPIIDIKDCARIILEIVHSVNQIKGEYSSKITAIEPTEIISAYDLLQSFALSCKSQGMVLQGDNVSKVFTEKWEDQDQPSVFQSSSMRTSRDSTFVEIMNELKGIS